MNNMPSVEEIKEAILKVDEWAFYEVFFNNDPYFNKGVVYSLDDLATKAPKLPRWAFACALFAELPISKDAQELILKAGNNLPKSDISGRDIANYYKSQITDFEALEAWERELIGL